MTQSEELYLVLNRSINSTDIDIKHIGQIDVYDIHNGNINVDLL